jgi:hypothetical protein
MGVNYSVVPYNSLFTAEETVKWLREYEMDLPQNAPYGRDPTPSEVRKVLDGLQDCHVDYVVNSAIWSAEIRCADDHTSINVLFSGNEDVPFDLSFRGGDEIVIHILRELAKVCGTFLLLTNGEYPTFIFPDGQ